MLQEALAGLRLKVTIDGQTYDSDLRPGDLVRYERERGKPLFGGEVDAGQAQKALDGDSDAAAELVGKFGWSMEDLFLLAYLGTRRQVEYTDFDDFLDRVTDIAMSGDEAVGKAPSPT